MDSWLRCWSLAAVLCSLPGTGETAGAPTNGTGLSSLSVEGDNSHKTPAAEILLSLLEKGTLDVEKTLTQKTRPGGEDSYLDNKPWRITKAKMPENKPPRKALASAGVLASSAAPTGQDNGVPATVSTLEYHPTGINIDNNESSICIGCGGETFINGKPPSRSLLSESNGGSVESVTNLGWPAEHGTVGWEFRKSLIKGDKPSASESQEDSGSGDLRVKMPSGQVTRSSSLKTEWDLGELMGMATSTPSQPSSTGSNTLMNPSTDKVISPDSAEIDHLLQVSRETTLQPPSPSGTEPRSQNPDKSRKEVSFEAGKPQGPLTVLEKMSSQSTAQGAQGSTDIAVVTESRPTDLFPTSVPPNGPPKPNESPSDLIDIDYNDPSDIDEHWPFPHFPDSPFAGGDSTKSLHDKLAPWHKPLHYDDFSPFDDSYFYPTPSFYADEYEEGGIEDDEDDDLEEVEDLDDEMATREAGNVLKAATLTPKVRTVMVDEKPTSRPDILFRGELFPKSHPDMNKDQTQTMSGTNENSTECRNGFVRRNNSCKSLCEIYPTYCYNGGQCYIVESTGALCRCNTQDYIWHKGLRCESIITDFQVMCVAVGTAALVVLLLFMMTVFFAKKLYLLKTENYKLRKRNRYRTPSELHNDNFSLSTIAEGSHPNEDPNASQKVQDLPKACLKDEEPFNIQNSLSPKLESGKGDPDIVDVNCVLNNLT